MCYSGVFLLEELIILSIFHDGGSIYTAEDSQCPSGLPVLCTVRLVILTKW